MRPLPLRPGPAPARTRSGVVATAPSATGIDGHVGWGRFTVFAIPIVPVYVTGDANAEVMAQVRDALVKAGYKPTTGAPGKGKVLTCHVEKISYNNYTWLFPIVPTWGSITLRTNLSSGGNVLWSHQSSGSGSTFNFFDGYTSANSKAMTEALNDMVTAFAGDDFNAALTRR